ncbi:ferredoxin--NADP(+) reductase [Limnohabitans sp. MMS-10A-160]|uniref:NAD(P)/FAD-dependent oxidoreductase n=1 Tax=unclassified Limnohabitans TaxID=2626134 RepID=UPI000D39713A|nr:MULTISPECIES: NAD(P)/FAD-dependent oxidoreductase [unclassified Limnohabitans]PUE15962.1 ferredoxin--NADP(+) reductase [Limnohabitans sp. MMS-10A-192]PUE23797.1 ferredoxin--NADP(+) reductase [Limnohabitans sp. MMS-10A-160]
MTTPIDTEALVIGAGPVGLFQVFQLGLQGIHCQVVDALPHVGGQCAELYPSKPIYDIPGIPFCTGSELVARLQQQIAPFKPTLHLGQQVSAIERLPDQRLQVQTASGSTFRTQTLFIAAGVGAFMARQLVLDGLSAFEGKQVFAEHPQPERWAGQHLVVAGDGDSALQACLAAIEGPQAAASVSLLHRRDQFTAAPELVAQMREGCAAGRMRFVAGQPTGLRTENGRLQALELLNPQGDNEWLPLDVLQTCLGLSPKLGPVAQWGLAMERKQLVVNTENFATSEPGIFAVGDINTYPGKKKLILCGFHEATLAAFGAVALLRPDEKTLLQYTTTSTLLHKRLGIA